MALNLFPVRVPIVRITGPDGRTYDGLMTQEFARALSDVFNRIGGANGISNDDLAHLAASDSATGLLPALSADIDTALTIASLQSNVATLTQQVEDLRAQLESLAAPVSLAGEIEQLRILVEMSTGGDAIAKYANAVNSTKQNKIPVATITGSRGGNVALASLLSGLATQGLIVNTTTA